MQSTAIDAAVNSIQNDKKASASPDSQSGSKNKEVDDQMKAYVVKAKEIKREEKENGAAHAGEPLAPKIKAAVSKDEIVAKAVQSGIAEEKLHSDLIKQHEGVKRAHRRSSEHKAALRYLEEEKRTASKYSENDLEQVVHMADKLESNIHPYEIIAANNHRVKHNKRPSSWGSIKAVLKLGQRERNEYEREVSANRDLKAALHGGEEATPPLVAEKSAKESRKAAESEEMAKADID